MLYVFSGLAAAAAGLILTSELDGASPSIGIGLELQVLTAMLLGGVAFAGGRGSLWGVLFGVLFIGALNNGLILLNIGPYVAMSPSARCCSLPQVRTRSTSGSSGYRCAPGETSNVGEPGLEPMAEATS